MRIGLTGGIASGKSTVGKLLRSHGFLVTDADSLVADLYLPGAAGARAVSQLFGSELLRPDGGVDHEALAARVFADADSRRSLEKAIHPLVGRRFAEIAEKAEKEDRVVVFEAPLLVDTGGYRNFDFVVTVEATEELRIARAVARGLEESAARARLAAQVSRDRRVSVADFVIENDGSLEQLEQQVGRLVERLAGPVVSPTPGESARS